MNPVFFWTTFTAVLSALVGGLLYYMGFRDGRFARLETELLDRLLRQTIHGNGTVDTKH